MADTEIKEGDVVVLKHGGYQMTVGQISGESVTVWYWDSNNLTSRVIHIKALSHIPPPQW
jgi:uncharacterized protein YodC (DUF2158 family)